MYSSKVKSKQNITVLLANGSYVCNFTLCVMYYDVICMNI